MKYRSRRNGSAGLRSVPTMFESLERRQLLADVPAGFVDSVVTANLGTSTAVEVANDGRVFVAEQAGRLRIVRNGQLLPEPALQLNVSATGERGLIGVALSPDFEQTGHIYIYYTASDPQPHNRLSRFTLSGDTVLPRSERVLLDLPAVTSAFHNGGGVQFGPDGKLYLAVGDHNVAGAPQSLESPFGKILRLNPDGSIPEDNPYYARTTGTNRAIWALGLRNPFSFAFSQSGKMYINDVGSDKFEEINLGVAGANYGWPIHEGSDNGDARYRDPIHAYAHANGSAIVGSAVYEPAAANFPPGYRSKYFFADFGSGEIRFLNQDTHTPFTFATGLTTPTALTVAPTGELYYLQSSGASGSSLGRITYATADNVTIKVNTNVPGLTVNVGGQSYTGPSYVFGKVGSRVTLEAPLTQTVDGITWSFTGWSNRGTASHAIFFPENTTNYLATYERVGEGTPLSPLPPTGVRVETVPSHRQLNLFWNDQSDNEAGYKIERSRNGGAFSLVAQMGENANRYFDLPPSTGTYTYRVRAFNAFGHSSYSAEVTIDLLV